jgi:hypothetical protein
MISRWESSTFSVVDGGPKEGTAQTVSKKVGDTLEIIN